MPRSRTRIGRGLGLRTLELGVKSLMLHKLRSVLTMLGTLFGVSSVISMLAVGEGASHEALEQIKALGPTNLMVRSQKPSETRRRRAAAAAGKPSPTGCSTRMRSAFARMFPQAEAGRVRARDVAEFAATARNWSSSVVVGTSAEYLDVVNLEVAEGRWISGLDLERRENSVVLGIQLPPIRCSRSRTRSVRPCRREGPSSR